MPASTSVKFFHSGMSGAPQISGSLGSLIAVLDACLVNGWGLTTVDSLVVASNVATANIAAGHPFVLHQVVLLAGATPSGLNGEARVTEVTTNTVKFAVTGVADGTATGTITMKVAPLGWLKAFTGTNKGAYKVNPALHPDSTGCYARIDGSANAYSTKIGGYEAMTSVDAGTGLFPTSAQVPTALWIMKTESPETTEYRPWFIVGDSRMVYIGTSHYFAAPSNNNGYNWAAFGEFKSVRSADPYRFLISAHTNTESPGTSTGIYNFCYSGRSGYQYLPRGFENLGGSVLFETASWPSATYSSGASAAPLAYPNGPNNGLYLTPLDIFERIGATNAMHLRGTYPGVLMVPHRVANRIAPDAHTAYMDTSVAGYEGRVVGFLPIGGDGEVGVVAFDLTGPWEH